jgi:hypothetical protein
MTLSDHRKLMRSTAYQGIIDCLRDSLDDGSMEERLLIDGFLDDEREDVISIIEREIAKYKSRVNNVH